jgi:hypothetical protein
MNLLAGFLGLGRPTALALLALSLQLPEVFSPALGDFLPTLPSKFDGGGIFRFWQNSEEALSPNRIMHDNNSQPKFPAILEQTSETTVSRGDARLDRPDSEGD